MMTISFPLCFRVFGFVFLASIFLHALPVQAGLLNAENTNNPSTDPIPSPSTSSKCKPGTSAPSKDCQLTKNMTHTHVSKFASGRPNTSGTHFGIDLFMPHGKEVDLPQGCKIYPCKADGSTGACDGKKADNGDYVLFVQNSGKDKGYGTFMLFDCSEIAGGNDVCVRYAHLEGFNSDSQKAINGSTGNAGGNKSKAHVHYEIIIDGEVVDPPCVWGEWGLAANNTCDVSTGGSPANLCDKNILQELIKDGVKKRGKSGDNSSRGCSAGKGTDYSQYANQGTFAGSGPGNENPTNIQAISNITITGVGTENARCDTGCCPCTDTIVSNHKDRIRPHVDVIDGNEKDSENSEFEEHRKWLIYTYFHQHILRAAKMMTSQLTAVGIDQVQAIGRLLDAKHQLETQRLFQHMKAQAHKDYHPSEGLCKIGTNVRSLAASERLSDLTHIGLSQQMMQRLLLSGKNAAQDGVSSDKASRLENFIEKFCNPKDNGNGLKLLCPGGGKRDMRNTDVDFTRSVETKLTLDLDFKSPGNSLNNNSSSGGSSATKDTERMTALTANLLGHDLFPKVGKSILAASDGRVRQEAVNQYMKARAISAKRSVAANSLAALIAMRASGDPEVAPFAKKLVIELGISEDDIDDLLGKYPSYFAQMEVLTKKAYTNPNFYTELYDKPSNVDRKNLALRAIGVMQDRDLYKSILRSEATMAVILEQMLQDEHRRLQLKFKNLNDDVREANQ